jgi:hypothetical protein
MAILTFGTGVQMGNVGVGSLSSGGCWLRAGTAQVCAPQDLWRVASGLRITAAREIIRSRLAPEKSPAPRVFARRIVNPRWDFIEYPTMENPCGARLRSIDRGSNGCDRQSYASDAPIQILDSPYRNAAVILLAELEYLHVTANRL